MWGECADLGKQRSLLLALSPVDRQRSSHNQHYKGQGWVHGGTRWQREGTLLSHLDFPPSDIMSLKRMLEKLGVPKTHLELKKLIREVSSGSEETFSYSDFLTMMLGKRSAILRV